MVTQAYNLVILARAVTAMGYQNTDMFVFSEFGVKFELQKKYFNLKKYKETNMFNFPHSPG